MIWYVYSKKVTDGKEEYQSKSVFTYGLTIKSSKNFLENNHGVIIWDTAFKSYYLQRDLFSVLR